jgi:membrane associated rhomboid family serine protease
MATLEVDMSGGVAWWAHVGGFLAGLILMPLVREEPARARGSGPGRAERAPPDREWEP